MGKLYSDFVGDLQVGIREALYDRPSKATTEYFIGKTIMVGEQPVVIDARQAKDIYRYLLKHDYIDDDDNITADYRKDKENGVLAACHETDLIDVDLVERYFYRHGKTGQHCTRCNCSLEAKLGPYGLYIQCCGYQRHKYKLDEI